jgi:hypothetical protein
MLADISPQEAGRLAHLFKAQTNTGRRSPSIDYDKHGNLHLAVIPGELVETVQLLHHSHQYANVFVWLNNGGTYAFAIEVQGGASSLRIKLIDEPQDDR